MKGKGLFFVVALFLFTPFISHAQNHEMVVDDFLTSGKFLEEVILGDTTADGQRADLDRVYVLKRGGSYYISVSLENKNTASGAWPLRIKAQDGDGARPIIYAYRGTSGNYSAQMFQNDDVLDLKGLILVGWSQGIEDFDRNVTRIINNNALGGSIYIDDCVLKDGKSTLIQTTAAASYVKLTNSVFANSANLRETNIGNGRAVDFRDVAIDSVLIENCSFMNFTDRVLRHYNAKAPLNKFTLNHCTFLNGLAEHGCISLGLIQGDVTITNNLFVDNFIFGNDSTAYQGTDSRMAEFAYTGEMAPNGQYVMTFIGSVPNDTSYISWDVKNNYYSVSPSVQALYDEHQAEGIGDLVPLTHHINSKLGADSVNAFKKVASPIVFDDAPAIPIAFAEWFFKPIEEGGAGKSKNNGNFTSDVDFDRKDPAYFQNTIDLKYSQSSEAFSGGTDGKPVGALNWWDGVVSVQKYTNVIPNDFSLDQNYPNPFNPATKITYSIPKDSKVRLEVFDVLGRKVAELVNAHQSAGVYKVDFDGSQLSSGIYIYRLSTSDMLLTKKMMLLK